MINRLVKLRKKLTEKKLDGLLISSVSNIIYLTNYSGFSKEEREAFLLIARLGAKRAKNKQYILTDGRYTQSVKELIKDFKLVEISPKLPVEKALKKLIQKHKIKKLGFEGHDITFSEHRKLLQRFDDSNHRSLDSLRTVKSSDEISKIEKACELGDKAFEYILKKIKLGISEKELAFEIEFFIKKHGADISFPPIVAFGKNSAIPHHQASDKRLATSDKLVLLDFGAKLNNYCSDMTRTIFFGKPTSEQKRMYETVLEAQSHTINYLKSLIINHKSTKASDIDRVAREHIISKGYKTIPHSVGHGIGIEVHEAPKISQKSKDILKPGMVFTIEPGIYIPGLGGVRIEDVVVLGKTGPRILTGSLRETIL